MLKYYRIAVIVLVFCVLLTGLPLISSAIPTTISLAFDPKKQSADFGDLVSVDVLVTNPRNTHVGGFDFWVNYDSDIISLHNIVFGNSLGDLVIGENAGYEVDNSQNHQSVDLAGVWADWDGVSSLNQDRKGFSLFTMYFDTIGVGKSDLWLTNIFEDKANNNDLDLGGRVRDHFLVDTSYNDITLASKKINMGSITVHSVPEPGMALLLGLGLAALASFKKKTI